jgi:flagellar assembly factor FliW
LAIDPDYRLAVSAEDRALIGLPAGRTLQIGQDVVSAAIVTVRDGSSPTANLLAPVVINLSNRKAVQAVATESGYSLQHVLEAEEVAVCS